MSENHTKTRKIFTNCHNNKHTRVFFSVENDNSLKQKQIFMIYDHFVEIIHFQPTDDTLKKCFIYLQNLWNCLFANNESGIMLGFMYLQEGKN